MGAETNRKAVEATLLARLETVLHDAEVACEQDRLQRLFDTVATSAAGPHVALLVECALQELRSWSRPAVESVAVWDELLARADACLPSGDSTAARIRVQRTRHLRRCGRPCDLDDAVALARSDWVRADGVLGADDSRTANARLELAVALSERALGDDLLCARRMLDEEARSRADCYGAGHPFTWAAKHDLAQVLVRLAQGCRQPDQRAIRAEELARQVAKGRAERFGVGDFGALRARLVHAHALTLLGQATLAADEIRYVLAVARRVRAPLEPGLAERLLAAAQAAAPTPGARSAALHTARCALRLSAACYPADSRPVREALRLVDELACLA